MLRIFLFYSLLYAFKISQIQLERLSYTVMDTDRKLVCSLLLLGLIIALPLRSDPEKSITDSDRGAVLDHVARRKAAVRAGDFLLRILDDSGRFVYRINPMYPKIKAKYNWLRHAGSVYSLCQLYEVTRQEKYLDAANRATTNFVKHIKPVQCGGAGVYAALISDPAVTGSKPELGPVIKTGGCALAMIAMSYVDELNDSERHRPTLLLMSDYIRFCQRDSGDLNSKYILGLQGFDDWQSQYYQGETLVALARLQRAYPTDKNQTTMVRLLVYLADQWQASTIVDRSPQRPLSRAFDHWGLLGLNAGFDLVTDEQLAEHSSRWTRKKLLQLAVDYCEDELKRILVTGPTPYIGCFEGREGAVTPTSIRMEGIQAVQNLVFMHGRTYSVDFGQTIWWWDQRIDLALRFLLSAQYSAGHAAMWPDIVNVDGAIHRSAVLGLEERSSEIRIDYCQHVISALLGKY